MIDVIIPVYNSHKTLEKTLMSIAIQKNKNNINVYIVDDNSFNDYKSIVKNYDTELNIKVLTLKNNKGPGVARQYGLDCSKGKYVTFIDSDDLFLHSDSILKMYQEIEKGYDYVYGLTCYEELKADLFSDSDLHSKIYRREFLTQNNIKFNNTYFHEDNAFNSLVIINNPRTSAINETLYFYCKNDNSITKIGGEELAFMRLEIYVDNMNYVLKEAINNNCNNVEISHYLYRKYKFLVDLYNSLDYQKLVMLKQWLKKYDFSHYINMLNTEQQNEIYLFI